MSFLSSLGLNSMFVQTKPFVVYVLSNELQKLSIGFTGQFEKRMRYHNGEFESKPTSYTKKNKRGNWILVYAEEYASKADALKREKQLKSFRGREFIRKKIV